MTEARAALASWSVETWKSKIRLGTMADHNFCKNEQDKEKPQATGVDAGLLRFLMGGTYDGEGKPITAAR
jgi:hypothetical protein